MSNRHSRIKTLVRGKFTSNDLIISVKKSNRKISKTVEKQIEKIWKIKELKTKKEKRNLYNGILYRLNYIKKNKKKVIN